MDEPRDLIEWELGKIANLDDGVRPSQIEGWCRWGGLGMKWFHRSDLMRVLEPNLEVWKRLHDGRPWTLYYNSRDGHF